MNKVNPCYRDSIYLSNQVRINYNWVNLMNQEKNCTVDEAMNGIKEDILYVLATLVPLKIIHNEQSVENLD